MQDDSAPAPARAVMSGPLRVDLTSRSLVLVAGMPGAGKSTLLAGLPSDPRVTVLDSDRQRAVLRQVLPAWLPYGCFRWLVHLMHRAAAVGAALGPVPVVAVHLPATRGGLRRAVLWVAWATRRRPLLVWVEVQAGLARDGQFRRGRVVTAGSFTAHAHRAVAVGAALRAGTLGEGWHSATVLERCEGVRGLRVVDLGTPSRPVSALRQ